MKKKPDLYNILLSVNNFLRALINLSYNGIGKKLTFLFRIRELRNL